MPKQKVRLFYLTMFVFRHRRYVLCRHKHKTFNSAKNCIERTRTDLKSTANVFICEIEEHQIWLDEYKTMISFSGIRGRRKQQYSNVDVLDYYYDGSKKTVQQITREAHMTINQLRRLRYEEHLAKQQQTDQEGAA